AEEHRRDAREEQDERRQLRPGRGLRGFGRPARHGGTPGRRRGRIGNAQVLLVDSPEDVALAGPMVARRSRHTRESREERGGSIGRSRSEYTSGGGSTR